MSADAPSTYAVSFLLVKHTNHATYSTTETSQSLHCRRAKTVEEAAGSAMSDALKGNPGYAIKSCLWVNTDNGDGGEFPQPKGAAA